MMDVYKALANSNIPPHEIHIADLALSPVVVNARRPSSRIALVPIHYNCRHGSLNEPLRLDYLVGIIRVRFRYDQTEIIAKLFIEQISRI